MKNKVLLSLAVLLLALSVLACGTPKPTQTPPTAVPPTQAPPPTQVPPTEAPKPTDAAPVNQGSDIEVVQVIYYPDEYGTYHIVGLIKNNSSTPYENIELIVEAKDASGNTLVTDLDGNPADTATFYPLSSNLFPGETTAFDYTIYSDNNPKPDKVIVSFSKADKSSAKRGDVVVENAQLFNDGGSFYISGELVNKSSQPVYIDDLVGAIFSAQNEIMGADWTTSVAYYLTPAGDQSGMDRTPFVISINGPENISADRYELYVDATESKAYEVPELYVNLDHNYFDSMGSFHVIGSIENRDPKRAFSTYLLTGLYDANGVVLDAVSSSLPMYIQPGQIVPFDATYFSVVDWYPSQADLVDTFTVQIDPYWTYESPYEVIELEASNVKQTLENNAATFTGEVTNTGTKDLSWISVQVNLYESDVLIATNYTTVFPDGDAIAAGATNPFELNIYLSPNQDTTNIKYEVIVQGVVK